ncbi:MAG: hypothetical protein N2B06_12395 [Clostridium sp.]
MSHTIDDDVIITGNLDVTGDLDVAGIGNSGVYAYNSGNQTMNLNPVLFTTVTEFGANQALISYSAGEFTFDVAGTYEIIARFTVHATTPSADYSAKVDWRAAAGGPVIATQYLTWGTTTSSHKSIVLHIIETVTAATVRRFLCAILTGTGTSLLMGGSPSVGDGIRSNVIIRRL